ncbi:DUF748 domain-containing protein [Pseudomaricurvus sp.]|uniref:DUF748 domain-containing protein n=1 Tax=Pseudomaricurvus sp. TaxID=2004510 RepID=UPI003F6D5264
MNKRVWTRSALVLLLLFLVFLPLLLSLAIKYSLTSELEKRGMSEVSVEKLWLNPYTGVASIQGLNFSKDTEHYHLNELELDLELSALWGSKVRVKGLRLVSARLVLRQDAEGNFIINDINLAGDATQEVVEEVVEDEPEVDEDATTWQFALDSLGVEDVRVLVDLPNVLADVNIEKISIARLDTGVEHKGDVDILLQLNKLVLPSAKLEASLALKLSTLLDLERRGLDSWKLVSHAESTLSDIQLMTPQGQLSLPDTHLKLDGEAEYIDADWTLKADTKTTLSRLDVKTPDVAVILPEGVIGLKLDAASESGEQTLSGLLNLALTKLEVETAKASTTIKLPKAALQMNIDGSVSGETQAAILKSKLTLTDLDLKADENAVKLPKLTLELDANGNKNGDWAVTGTTKTALSELEVRSPQALLHWANAEINIDSEASLGEAVSYQADVDIVADEGVVKTGPASAGLKDAPLADLKKLTLTSSLQGDSSGDQSTNDVTVKQLLLSGLTLLSSPNQPPLVSDANLSLDGMSIALPSDDRPLDVVVDKIALPKAAITFIRNSDGEMPQLAAILPPQSEQPDAEASAGGSSASQSPTQADSQTSEQGDKTSSPSESEAASGTPVLVKHLLIGPDVVVDIADAGVKPPFEEKVRFTKLDIKNLSLKDSSEAAELSMALLLTHDAAISAEGKFNALAPSADVKIKLDEYQLLSLSGYSEQFTGYALETGVFNLSSTVKLADNTLDSHNEAIINHVTLRPEHTDTVENFAHSLTMPLDQALDLLRDSNDQIKLEVPVTGALNDPDVDIQQIINKALAGAMKKASMLVLQSLLQPYGAIITVAQMAGEKMTEVKLDSVKFEAGSSELNAVAQDYAGKIGAMLTERQALTLKMCGRTNLQDFQALMTAGGDTLPAPATDQPATTAASQIPVELAEKYKDPLKKLGNARTDNLKRYLRDALKVPSSQLLVCLPKHKADASALSGVELSF